MPRLRLTADEVAPSTVLQRASALGCALDGLGHAVAVYDGAGAPLHRSEALRALLAAEPAADCVVTAMNALAQRLARAGAADAAAPAADGREDRRADVRTPTAEYRLLGCPVTAELFGAEGVLVIVQPRPPLLPDAAEVRRRYGLTAREAEAALLLAEGLSDARLAERLEVSPHTARRYAERVLRKLGVHSRAAVALALLRAPATEGETGTS